MAINSGLPKRFAVCAWPGASIGALCAACDRQTGLPAAPRDQFDRLLVLTIQPSQFGVKFTPGPISRNDCAGVTPPAQALASACQKAALALHHPSQSNARIDSLSNQSKA